MIDIVANAVEKAASGKDLGGLIFRFAASECLARIRGLPHPLAHLYTTTPSQIHRQQSQQALHDQLQPGREPAQIKDVRDCRDRQPATTVASERATMPFRRFGLCYWTARWLCLRRAGRPPIF